METWHQQQDKEGGYLEEGGSQDSQCLGSNSVLQESLGWSVAWAIAYGNVCGGGCAGARARQAARRAAEGSLGAHAL